MVLAVHPDGLNIIKRTHYEVFNHWENIDCTKAERRAGSRRERGPTMQKGKAPKSSEFEITKPKGNLLKKHHKYNIFPHSAGSKAQRVPARGLSML